MLFKPFDYNPVSVAVKTGSYIIPAGRYARVLVTVSSGSFSIDGTNAIDGIGANNAAGAFEGGVSSGEREILNCLSDGEVEIYIKANVRPATSVRGHVITFRPNNNSLFDFEFARMDQNSANDYFYLNRNIDNGSTVLPASGRLVVKKGDRIIDKYDDNTQTSFVDVVVRSISTPVTAEFWVPAGATINGSGEWEATVSEYIIPT